jgi:hypothetical protein
MQIPARHKAPVRTESQIRLEARGWLVAGVSPLEYSLRAGGIKSVIECLGDSTMKFQKNDNKEPATPIWVWALVIAGGVALGLILKPILQGGNSSTSASVGTPSVRCEGPANSELALSEYIEGGGLSTDAVSTNSVTFTRQYQLERPGQPLLAFGAPSDSTNTPLSCNDVRFGPGPRVLFARGTNAVIVELVGPLVKTFDATTDQALTKLVLEPRWKLGLKLEDYQAAVPKIDDSGKRIRIELNRKTANRAFPTTLVMQSKDGGSSFQFLASESLGGF